MAISRQINQIKEIVLTLSQKHLIDPYLIFGIIMTESSGNPNADSGYARGLMQISKIALKDTKLPYNYEDLFDPEKNIEVGIVYLKKLENYFLKRYGLFHLPLTILAYAWGIGNVNRWLKDTKADNRFIDEAIPPEKKDYLYNVMFWTNKAREILMQQL